MLKISFILVVLLTLTVYKCKSHGCGTKEAPAFKYSRSANEQYQKDEQHQKDEQYRKDEQYQEDEQHHKDEHHTHHHEELRPNTARQKLPSQQLWFNAIASTLLISAAHFLLIFVIPLESRDKEQLLLKILLAFVSGGLLGDALLHLISNTNAGLEDYGSHSHRHGGEAHDESHNMYVGLWVLAGIVVFLVAEKGVRIIKGSVHGHHGELKEKNGDENKDVKKSDNIENAEEPVKDIKVEGYSNLAADFKHNFTDGFVIGSSYLAGNAMGIVSTITILLQEVPHEIGDFAILWQSEVSRNRIFLQLIPALGAVSDEILFHGEVT